MDKQKLYYFDSYTTDFQANIIETVPYEDKFALILDKTYFYPESGGQGADRGTINGEEAVYVTESEGKTLHIVENMLPAGPAQCHIDWDTRFDYMQQHSGQHILSACFYKLFNGETSSFHIGKDSSTIEINVESFDNLKTEQIEELVDSIISRDLPVTSAIVDKEDLASLPLRKKPQVESNIRIISIEDCDCSPCGGTHVNSTGEINIVKIKKYVKLKNSYKFEFVCGKRALKDYTYKNYLVNKLGAYLSAPEHDVENAFIKFSEDYNSLQKQISQLREELVHYDVQLLQQESVQIGDLKVFCKVFENRDFNDVKLMSQALVSDTANVALLASSQSNQLIFARSEDVDINMNNLLKAILPLINGKGGGSPKAAQGGGSGDMHAALKAAVESLMI